MYVTYLLNLQQVGKLKKQELGVLKDIAENVNVNEQAFSDVLIEKYINDFRKENKLNSVVRYDPLCALAKIRVQEIKTDWSHKGFETRSEKIYTDFCNKGNIICTAVGENLAKGDFSEEKDVVVGWENSPKHREAMLGEYNVQCVAVSGKYYVSLFAYTQDLEELKQKELSSMVTYNYDIVIFWEKQKTLSENYKDNWERGKDNNQYNKGLIQELLSIFEERIKLAVKLWDGYTNTKITNQEAIDMENKYWELAEKSAKLSQELNDKAYNKCLSDGVKESICKGYKK